MRAIYVYSRKKDGQTQLSKNFKVREFACKDGSDPVFVAELLVIVLQAIRGTIGKPVTITSAYRTPGHNAREGGVSDSQHLYGMAADIVVEGMSPLQVADVARKIMPDWGGVGVYAKRGFTHVDVREERVDWSE